MDEPFLRLLVSQLEIVVVDVDYRLAPEYPAPIPGDDAYAALNLVSSRTFKCLFFFPFLTLRIPICTFTGHQGCSRAQH